MVQEDSDVCLHGVPGLDLAGVQHQVHIIQTLRPGIVFLEIGANDLCQLDPHTVSERVLAFAKTLVQRHGVQRVVISQVLYRQCAIARRTPHNFNERVAIYNAKIQTAVVNYERIHFWKHRGFWSNWPQLLTDGIHLNQRGLRKYYNSVRGAIIGMLNLVNPRR